MVAISTPAFFQTATSTPDFPVWTPPPPRLKSFTLFAPKPFTGDNIFKGEREGWLADAIVKLEVGHLNAIRDKAVSDYITQLWAKPCKIFDRTEQDI